MTAGRSGWSRLALGGAALVAALGVLGFEVVRTAPVRGAVGTLTALIAVANGGDPVSARVLCSARYLAGHDLRAAGEGGIVGLPRSIHKNFRAWKSGPVVLICPTDTNHRTGGPVYRFVPEAGAWKFDGPIGVLGPGGTVVPLADSAIGDEVDGP